MIKNILVVITLLSSLAISYEVANIGAANTMVCSYSRIYNNGSWKVLPEFEQTISYMKVRKGGRVIIAPKGTKYVYDRVEDNGIMRYNSTNGKYIMFVYPTKRAKSVGGNIHNYTDILVGNDTTGKFSSGSCRLEVNR